MKVGILLIEGRKCNSCKSEIQRSELDNNYSICPHCGYYMRMHAKKREGIQRSVSYRYQIKKHFMNGILIWNQVIR